MLNQTHSRTENQLQLLNETLTSSLQQSLSATQQNNLTAETQFQFLNMTLTGQFLTFPVSSCAALLELHPSSPSSYYWVKSSNGSAVRVYCNMTLSCGNITEGWMRVANLDMRDSSTQCPGNLTERIYSSIRTCETPSTSTCYQITYSTDPPWFYKEPPLMTSRCKFVEMELMKTLPLKWLIFIFDKNSTDHVALECVLAILSSTIYSFVKYLHCHVFGMEE